MMCLKGMILPSNLIAEQHKASDLEINRIPTDRMTKLKSRIAPWIISSQRETLIFSPFFYAE